MVPAGTRPDDRKARAIWGLTRSLLANAVEGVTKGFEKRLVVVGIGYRADSKGKSLELQLGYSHPILVEAPAGIDFSAPMGEDFTVRIKSPLDPPFSKGRTVWTIWSVNQVIIGLETLSSAFLHCRLNVLCKELWPDFINLY